jgi:hypothetical protein
MPEMTVKYNKEELEDMLVRLLLRPQGLKLAAVDKPIQWRFRPQLKVVIHAEVDPDAVAAPVRDDATETEQPDDPLAEAASRRPAPSVEDLDPTAFPEGTNLALLKDTVKAEQEAEKRPLMPGESHERTKK